MADGREEDGWRGWPPAPDVVAAARSGDETLVREILVAGMPKLMAFYRGLGLRHHDAEDVAAEAGEAVVRHLGRPPTGHRPVRRRATRCLVCVPR